MTTWIFLRGLTRESRHWGSFPATFRAAIPDAAVVTLDLPGNGRLRGLRSASTVEEMADYCRAELRSLGMLPPYHLLAMSLGAMLAVAWAIKHPAELRGSVLINTSLRPFSPFYRRLRPENYITLLRLTLVGGSDRDWEETILRLTSRRNESTADVLTGWVSYRREYPVSRSNAIRQLFAAARYRAPLVKPAIPTLILVSNGDELVDSRCSKQLAHAWKTDIVEHPGAGHDIPLDDGAWGRGRCGNGSQVRTDRRDDLTRIDLNIPNMGSIMPNMGMRTVSPPVAERKSLADALFSNTQQRVLALLFGQPERTFYATELIGLVGGGSGAVQRELARLEQSGLVTTKRIGNQKHYQANADSPIFAELHGIAQKTVGLAEPLRDALAPLAAKIRVAFVYGSVAKRKDTAASDIDLMVVSDSLTYADVFGSLESVGAKLGRPINPTVYSRKELARRLKEGNAFVTRVFAQPKIWLIGREDDIAA